MTQPGIPPKDNKTEHEKLRPPPIAREHVNDASKEATTAEGNAEEDHTKADEAANAKKAAEDKEAEKKGVKLRSGQPPKQLTPINHPAY